jgi:hypothetical protein
MPNKKIEKKAKPAAKTTIEKTTARKNIASAKKRFAPRTPKRRAFHAQ